MEHSRAMPQRVSVPPDWKPHPDADARRESAIALAKAVLAGEGVSDSHRRQALSLAIWKYTEADGKWRTRYRSVAAVGVDYRLLNHEHVLTRKQLIDLMLKEGSACDEIMATAIGCCVLREEHRRLTAVERADPTLAGWERYRAAAVPVVDQATGRRIME